LQLHTCIHIICTVFIFLPLSQPPPHSHWCQPPFPPWGNCSAFFLSYFVEKNHKR
jgi:hypothetical protein